MNLTIVGTIGLDTIKTPFGRAKDILGGSASYASSAASFFTNPAIISVVGHDLPSSHLHSLAQRGVNLDGVKTQGKNFRWAGTYKYDMNEAKTSLTELNCLADFKPRLSGRQEQADFLFLANIDPDLQLAVLAQTARKPFVLTDTMDYWIEKKRAKLIEVIKKSTAVAINEGEARQLFGTANLIKAGKSLLELGPEYAIIKKSEHGAMLFSLNDFFAVPGYPLEEVYDPTGAGDSFAGGLIGYLAKTKDLSEPNLRKATIYGSAIASLCAESFGLGYLAKTTNKDIEERYEVFRQMGQF